MTGPAPTPAQAALLRQLRRAPLVDEVVAPATMQALIRRGWARLHHGGAFGQLLITDAGREALTRMEALT